MTTATNVQAAATPLDITRDNLAATQAQVIASGYNKDIIGKITVSDGERFVAMNPITALSLDTEVKTLDIDGSEDFQDATPAERYDNLLDAGIQFGLTMDKFLPALHMFRLVVTPELIPFNEDGTIDVNAEQAALVDSIKERPQGTQHLMMAALAEMMQGDDSDEE